MLQCRDTVIEFIALTAFRRFSSRGDKPTEKRFNKSFHSNTYLKELITAAGDKFTVLEGFKLKLQRGN